MLEVVHCIQYRLLIRIILRPCGSPRFSRTLMLIAFVSRDTHKRIGHDRGLLANLTTMIEVITTICVRVHNSRREAKKQSKQQTTKTPLLGLSFFRRRMKNQYNDMDRLVTGDACCPGAPWHHSSGLVLCQPQHGDECCEVALFSASRAQGRRGNG